MHPRGDRFAQGKRVQTCLLSQLCKNIEVSYIEAVGKIGAEKRGVKFVEASLFSAEFRGQESGVGVGQKGPGGKRDPERGSVLLETPVHAPDVLRAEEVGQGAARCRRFRMDLDSPPHDGELEFLFQLFDDALADEAIRSDVIGKDLDFYRHARTFPVR